MASLTIRNLEDDTKERLRVRAARNGRSMEEEARVILRTVVAGVTGADLWARSRALFADTNGVNLVLPSRRADRTPPALDDE
jgi:plasmid stability protein